MYQYQYQHCHILCRMESKCQYFQLVYCLTRDKKWWLVIFALHFTTTPHINVINILIIISIVLSLRLLLLWLPSLKVNLQLAGQIAFSSLKKTYEMIIWALQTPCTLTSHHIFSSDPDITWFTRLSAFTLVSCLWALFDWRAQFIRKKERAKVAILEK